MKLLNYLSLLLLFAFLFACKKEDPNPDNPQPPENKDSVDIGSFSLLETSRNMVPYKDKSSVTFVDSAGNELVFPIDIFANKTSHGCYWKYDVHEPGDTVKYCYKSKYDSYRLKNEANNLYLRVHLEAAPYFGDPESGKVADVLNVSMRDAVETNIYRQIFYQTIDQRSHPEPFDDNTIYPQITFWGRDFSNVSKTNFSTPYRLLYYNQEFGIVAFTDHDGKLWRFKEMF
jgi:hypothetical protein